MSFGLNLFGTPFPSLGLTNLIVNNPGFEGNLNNWVLSPSSLGAETKIVTTPVRTGTKALQFGLNPQHYIYRFISIEVGAHYKYGCWAICNTSPNNVYLYAKGAVDQIINYLTFSSNYTECFISFVATGTNLECGIGVYEPVNSQAVYLDDFFLYKL